MIATGCRLTTSETDGHQDVAVQELQYEIGNDQPDEDRFETPLKIRYQRDGQRHHGGADIGDQYGQAHGNGEQGRVIQPEKGETMYEVTPTMAIS